jgi:ABC-2 type transport system permease protein
VTAVAGSATGARPLAGLGRLVRFVLRRDRVRLPVWLLSIAVVVLGSVASFGTTYPTAADRQQRGDLVGANAAARLFTGPGFGIDHYTFGAMTANELLPLTCVVVALMSLFLVIRHTRGEEEAGHTELLRAYGAGRRALPAAAFVVVAGANLLLGLVLAFGLPISLDGLGSRGSVAFAAAVVGVGLVFTALGLLTAQLSVTARGAVGLAALVLGALYLLRGVADITGSALVWLSPFGWATEMRAYVDERWWPLALSVTLAAALTTVAARVAGRRDLGAGLLADRPGPARASRLLGSPVGLAFRLQRTALVAWTVPLLLIGVLYGSIAKQAAASYDNNTTLEGYLAHGGAADPADQFLALELNIMALVATVFVITAVTRLRSEETAGRAEPVLAAAVSRSRWLAGHLTVAVVGSVVLLVAAGLGVGVGRALSVGDAAELPSLVGASLAYAPAVWTFAGLAVLLVGLFPRATGVAWAALGVILLIGLLGPLLNLPGWSYDLSPFEQTPRLPADQLTILPLLLLTGIALVLAGVGTASFRRRDVR